MNLYIGPLPIQISYSRFKHYFKGFERYMNVQIRHVTREGQVFSYALVTTPSYRIGKKLIAKFNGKILNGMPVVVREFIHRCTGNERRSVNWRNQPWKFFNRRKIDRRQYRQIMELEDLWLANKEQPYTDNQENKKRLVS